MSDLDKDVVDPDCRTRDSQIESERLRALIKALWIEAFVEARAATYLQTDRD